MSINIRGRIYTNRQMNIYREFHVVTKKHLYTHENKRFHNGQKCG